MALSILEFVWEEVRTMNCPNDNFKHIPKEKFAFVQKDQRLHDRELEPNPLASLKMQCCDSPVIKVQ